MRQISGTFAAELARKDLTLCRVMALTLNSGVTYLMTDHSSDVWYGEQRYRSQPGFKASNVRGSLSGAAENATVQIGYAPDQITELMVRGGAVDDGTYTLTVISWSRPDIVGMRIFEGRIQAVNASDKSSVTLDIGGPASVALTVGEFYSQRCRNVFGDRRCKVNVDKLSVDFRVLSVAPNGYTFAVNQPLDTDVETRPAVSQSGTKTYMPATADNKFVVPMYDIITFRSKGAAGAGGNSLRGALIKTDHLYDRTWPGHGGGSGGDTFARGADGTEYIRAPGGFGGIGGTLDRPNGPGKRSAAPGFVPYAGAFPGVTPYTGAPGGKGADRSLILVGLGSFRGGDADDGMSAVRTYRRGDPGAPVVGDTITFTVGKGGVPVLDDPLPQFTGLPGGDGSVTVEYAFNSAAESASFNNGTILWLDGLNKGSVSGIGSNDDANISLSAFPNYAVQPGDNGRFRPSCTNYADDCKARFNNLINMQAEPAVPQGIGSAPTSTTTVVKDESKPASPPSNSLAGARPYSAG